MVIMFHLCYEPCGLESLYLLCFKPMAESQLLSSVGTVSSVSNACIRLCLLLRGLNFINVRIVVALEWLFPIVLLMILVVLDVIILCSKIYGMCWAYVLCYLSVYVLL